MAQKNYEKLLTELMKKIPQNRLVKHLFLNYTIGKGGNEFLVINKILPNVYSANRQIEKKIRQILLTVVHSILYMTEIPVLSTKKKI